MSSEKEKSGISFDELYKSIENAFERKRIWDEIIEKNEGVTLELEEISKVVKNCFGYMNNIEQDINLTRVSNLEKNEKLQKFREKSKEIIQKYESEKKSRKEIDDELKTKNSELSEAKEKYQKHLTNFEKLKNNYLYQKMEKEKVEMKVTNLEENLLGKESQMKEVQESSKGQVTKLEEKMVKLEEKIDKKDELVVTYSKKIEGLEVKNEMEKKKFEEKLEGKKKEIEELNKTMENVREEYEQKLKEAEEKRVKDVDELNKKIEGIQKDMEEKEKNHKSVVEEKDRNSKKVDGERKELLEEKEKNMKKIEKQQKEVRGQTEEILKLSKKISETSYQIEHLIKFIDSTKLRGEGWLLKQGHVRKNWKWRWVVADNKNMEFQYYKFPEDPKPLKVMKIPFPENLKVVEEKGKHPHCFALISEYKREKRKKTRWEYKFCASNDTEMARWMKYWKREDEAMMGKLFGDKVRKEFARSIRKFDNEELKDSLLENLEEVIGGADEIPEDDNDDNDDGIEFMTIEVNVKN